MKQFLHIDIVDKLPVIIKRHGKVVYEDKPDPEERVAETIFEGETMTIQKVYKGYCLWFEGRIVWRSWESIPHIQV